MTTRLFELPLTWTLDTNGVGPKWIAWDVKDRWVAGVFELVPSLGHYIVRWLDPKAVRGFSEVSVTGMERAREVVARALDVEVPVYGRRWVAATPGLVWACVYEGNEVVRIRYFSGYGKPWHVEVNEPSRNHFFVWFGSLEKARAFLRAWWELPSEREVRKVRLRAKVRGRIRALHAGRGR